MRRSRTRSFYLGLALVVACGSHSSTKRSGGKQDAGAGGTAASAGDSGASGTTPTDAGEGGEGDGGRSGSNATGRGGAAGSGGMSGSAPVAGASTGGGGGQLGGNGGQSGLPLPDGCEARGRTEETNSCNLAAFCDGTPNIANCSLLDSGRWQCSCELEHNDRVYEIEGAPGLQACAVAIGLCSEDELVLGEETCTAVSNESGANECALDLACEMPITVNFARGVRAGLMSYGTSVCTRDQSDVPFECGCEASGGDGSFINYGVLAEDGSAACRPLVDFCMSGREPTFDGSTSCFDTDRVTDTGICTLNQVCATPMRLTDDVSLAKLETRYSNCEGNGSSGNDCYCSTQNSSFRFIFGTIPDAETCTLAIANCDHGAEIQVTSDPECQQTSRNAGPDSCEADLACQQYATVNGRQIIHKGRLLAACARPEAGEPWRCSCASNQDTTIFEFGGADMEAWDVCGAAPERCLERMDVYVGPYGEFVPPPDPLAPE